MPSLIVFSLSPKRASTRERDDDRAPEEPEDRPAEERQRHRQRQRQRRDAGVDGKKAQAEDQRRRAKGLLERRQMRLEAGNRRVIVVDQPDCRDDESDRCRKNNGFPHRRSLRP
jgi:hypothetical protein